MAISRAGVGMCPCRGLASASLTRVWSIQAQTSMEPFPNSGGLKEVSHNESHDRGTGRVTFQPSLAQHGHVM